jgi:hypothetical protein
MLKRINEVKSKFLTPSGNMTPAGIAYVNNRRVEQAIKNACKSAGRQ